MKRPFPAKKLVISLLVVLGLLVGVDFGAAAVAEYQVAQKMRSQLGLATTPAVRIHGFPFLTQAVRGNFRNVEIKARGVDVGRFTELGVQAELHHAKVSTADVLAGNVDKIEVREVVGRIRLKAADIGRFIGVEDLSISPAPPGVLTEDSGNSSSGSDGSSDQGSGGSDQDSGDSDQSEDDSDGSGSGLDTRQESEAVIKLDGTVNIAGTDNHVTVIAVLSLVGGKLRITPRELKLDNSAFGPIPLPEMFEKSVLGRFTTTLDPGKLPFEVTPTAVRVERGALVVEGTAERVTIDTDGLSTR